MRAPGLKGGTARLGRWILDPESQRYVPELQRLAQVPLVLYPVARLSEYELLDKTVVAFASELGGSDDLEIELASHDRDWYLVQLMSKQELRCVVNALFLYEAEIRGIGTSKCHLRCTGALGALRGEIE